MGDNERLRVHIWVRGRVQGVGFRAYVQQFGHMLGLTGWVRNVGWDQVEALAEGDKVVLEQFVAAVRSGPRASFVEDSRVEWEPTTGEFDSFQVNSSR
jgi:acylphosphatase